jgi:hypothetical protein
MAMPSVQLSICGPIIGRLDWIAARDAVGAIIASLVGLAAAILASFLLVNGPFVDSGHDLHLKPRHKKCESAFLNLCDICSHSFDRFPSCHVRI